MTTQEEARKVMAQHRQHEEHLKDNMLRRSQETIDRASSQELEEEARELMVDRRQHEEHLKENILSRAEEEIEGTTV